MAFNHKKEGIKNWVGEYLGWGITEVMILHVVCASLHSTSWLPHEQSFMGNQQNGE